MADPITLNLDIDLGENGGKLHFTTDVEVNAWVKKEQDFWSWLSRSNPHDGTSQNLANTFSQKWDRIHNRYSQLRQVPSPQRDGVLASVKSEWQDAYKQRQVMCSSTGQAQFLDGLRQRDPLAAARALAYFLGQQSDGAPACSRGVFLALAFEYGIAKTAEGEKAQIEALMRSWQEFRETSKTEWVTLAEKCKETDSAAEKQTGIQAAEFQRILGEMKKTLDEMRVASQERLSTIEKTYDEKMSLQSSVQYWAAKARAHKQLAVRFTIAALVAFLVVGAGLYFTLTLVVGDAKIVDVHLWKLGLIAVVATVGVWLIRVLVRLLLSHVHLQTEALERRTMLLTYLALLRNNKIPDNDDRRLILQVLFRPSSTGIVRDDASPPFMAEWLKRTTGVE